MATERELRRLPAPSVACSRCEHCGRKIVWATTVAGPGGPGGKLMPLDPVEDLAGNVAVSQPTARGRLLARVLCKIDGQWEGVDRTASDYHANTHFATCPARAAGAKPEIPTQLAQVIDLATSKAAQRARRGGRGALPGTPGGRGRR